MSLFVDLKYLKLISNRLVMFKHKGDNLYNCRCPICGDSAKKKNKARGFFYPVKNDLFYKCHNCGASLHFGSFLKLIDSLQHNQYVLERYSQGIPLNKPHQNVESKFKMEEPKFEKSEEKLIDKILDRLDNLPEDNEAVKFCINRKIPKEVFNKLYFIDDIKNISQLSDKYKDKLTTSEPRLVLPFYDKNGQLTGVTCRGLRNESLRYVTIKVKEDVPLVFGYADIDRSKPIYVVEGPIDSLFLPNSIAVTGTAFSKLEQLDLPKEKIVVIFDNQPRNKDVVKIMSGVIDKNYSVVIWPQTLEEKDINDMVLNHKEPLKIIKKSVAKGLEAKAKFIAWKRC